MVRSSAETMLEQRASQYAKHGQQCCYRSRHVVPSS